MNAPASSSLVAYFGYGSLVNRATHRTDIVDAFPARLIGWRRCWLARPDRPDIHSSLLSVCSEEGAFCDGLLVIDRLDNLAAVDERESGYFRHLVGPHELEVVRAVPDGCPVYVYEVDGEAPLYSGPSTIMQSYLDAVLQGFLSVYGETGVRHFLADTLGFDTPIDADRYAPGYPRAVLLTDTERALFDAMLAEKVVGLRDR